MLPNCAVLLAVLEQLYDIDYYSDFSLKTVLNIKMGAWKNPCALISLFRCST